MDPGSIRKDPKKVIYWRWVRFSLLMVGLWPKADLGEPTSRAYAFYTKYSFAITVVTLSMQIIYVRNHYAETSFLELGHMIITICNNILWVTRGLLGLDKAYGPMMHTFFSKIHLLNYECHYSNDYSKKLTGKIEVISRYIATYYLFIFTFGTPLFIITPWINNYTNGAFNSNNNITLQASLYMANPFDAYHNLKYWIIFSIYSYYPIYASVVTFVATDLCLFLIIFQIMGRILILENKLKTMARPALQRDWTTTYKGRVIEVQVDMFSETENAEIHLKLKQYINDHKFIQSFIEEVIKRYGLILLTNYWVHLVNGSIILLEIMDGGADKLARYAPLGVSVFGELIILSMILEQVRTLTEILGDAVYSTPWESMDTSNRRTVLLFLMRAQFPTVFKAKGVVEIGVKAMVSIIKTTVSYGAFLKRTSSEK